MNLEQAWSPHLDTSTHTTQSHMDVQSLLRKWDWWKYKDRVARFCHFLFPAESFHTLLSTSCYDPSLFLFFSALQQTPPSWSQPASLGFTLYFILLHRWPYFFTRNRLQQKQTLKVSWGWSHRDRCFLNWITTRSNSASLTLTEVLCCTYTSQEQYN